MRGRLPTPSLRGVRHMEVILQVQVRVKLPKHKKIIGSWDLVFNLKSQLFNLIFFCKWRFFRNGILLMATFCSRKLSA